MLAVTLVPFLLGTGFALIYPWLQSCGLLR